MRTRILTAAAVALAVFTLAACGSSAKTTTFTLEQGKPELATLPVNQGRPSMGDVVAFVAVTTRDGAPAGTISGILTAVDLPGNNIGDDKVEARIANIVFRFSPTDSITVEGSSVYPVSEVQMDLDLPQVRAVTGGTGTYIGARGQVTSTRHADGSYTHVFELLA